MGLPTEPVTLTPQAVGELIKKLSDFRHDVNNYLSLIVASGELVRYRPDMADKMASTVTEQAQKITEHMQRYSVDFEESIGITRG